MAGRASIQNHKQLLLNIDWAWASRVSHVRCNQCTCNLQPTSQQERHGQNDSNPIDFQAISGVVVAPSQGATRRMAELRTKPAGLCQRSVGCRKYAFCTERLLRRVLCTFARPNGCPGVTGHTNWHQMKRGGQVWNGVEHLYMRIQQACPKHAKMYCFYYTFGTMLARMLVVLQKKKSLFSLKQQQAF